MNKLRPGPPVTVGSVRIIPLERVQVEGAAGRCGLHLYASKTPVGVLISSQGQDRAVDLEGNPMPLDAVDGLADGALAQRPSTE